MPKDGHNFIGWKDANSSSPVFQGTKKSGTFTMPSRDVTLQAQWESTTPAAGNKHYVYDFIFNGDLVFMLEGSTYQYIYPNPYVIISFIGDDGLEVVKSDNIPLIVMGNEIKVINKTGFLFDYTRPDSNVPSKFKVTLHNIDYNPDTVQVDAWVYSYMEIGRSEEWEAGGHMMAMSDDVIVKDNGTVEFIMNFYPPHIKEVEGSQNVNENITIGMFIGYLNIYDY